MSLIESEVIGMIDGLTFSGTTPSVEMPLLMPHSMLYLEADLAGATTPLRNYKTKYNACGDSEPKQPKEIA